MVALCMHAHASLKMHVSKSFLPPSASPAACSGPQESNLLLCQNEQKPELEGKHSRFCFSSLCLPSYNFLLNEEDQR